MLQRLTGIIERIAAVRVLVVLALLAMIFPVCLFPAVDIGGARPLDLYLTYSPAQAYEYLAALGANGRSAYMRMESTLDMAFPVLYALALSVALALALRHLVAPESRWRHLALMPLLIVPADWGENLGLAMAACAFPQPMAATVVLASAFTTLKWFLLSITVMVLVTLMIGVIIRQLHGGQGG